MQSTSSRLRSGTECSTSCRAQSTAPALLRVSRRSSRCVRLLRRAVSDGEDRPGEQTYQKASSVPDCLPVVEAGSDWREFRARLVASSRSNGSAAAPPPHAGPVDADIGLPSSAGFNQLEWAHELSAPEAGCLLLAHPYMFRERQTYFYQAVLLLLDHGPDGSYGIILNRPTQYKVSEIRSSVAELLAGFPDNRLFMGGDCGEAAMVVLTHRGDVPGAKAVTDGVFTHNVHGAHAAVSSGSAEPADFRFFAQYAGWAPGQLEAECRAGVWFCTAASPSLTLNTQLSSGRDMWHAILQVMGGDHARVSDIVSEVERRDLRDAAARLLQGDDASEGSSTAECIELEHDVQQQQQQQQ